MNDKINIIYEDNHLLVVEKPVNMLMQADKTQDTDLLTVLKQYLVTTYNKPNDAYLGLVHRLDRPVGGVCVFAKTSKAAARLSQQIQNKQFQKTYFAVLNGHLNTNHDTYTDYLIKNNKTNTVTVTSPEKGKKSILSFDTLSYSQDLSLVKIKLLTGRSHQIRVQFASRGYPLWGDQRYNKNAVVKQQIALWSYQLTFIHPTLKTHLTFTCPPPTTKPWLWFERSNYDPKKSS